MPKSNHNNKHREQKKGRELKPSQKVSQNAPVFNYIDKKETRKSEIVPAHKTILIIGEGPTEAAYFEGLCKIWKVESYFVVTVLPEQTNNSHGHKGSSVKGLLYMAMKMQKQAKMKYDYVWIVTDNDEENAYKLDDPSIDRMIKANIPNFIIDKIVENQFTLLNVRVDEKEKQRIRFFLCLVEYKDFLFSIFDKAYIEPYIDSIISSTTKKIDFELLYESTNARAFFYSDDDKFLDDRKFEERYFDIKWKDYINIAYTSISFEHWLLFHFEQNMQPFYNSREIIKYFDDESYFTNYNNNQIISYEKGWFLYEYLDNKKIKAFFKRAKKAMINGFLVNTRIQQSNKSNKKFYELNPYSDVYGLVGLLLVREHPKLAYIGKEVNHCDLTNVTVSLNNSKSIDISFTYSKNQPSTLKEVGDLFILMEENNKPQTTKKKVNHKNNPIRKGDPVNIIIEADDTFSFPALLFLLQKQKGDILSLVWVMQ